MTNPSNMKIQTTIKKLEHSNQLYKNLNLYTLKQLKTLNKIFIILNNKNANHILTKQESNKLKQYLIANNKIYIKNNKT